MNFYKVPDYIFNPIADRKICSGNVLVVADPASSLTNQVKKQQGLNVLRSEGNDEPNPEYWKGLKDIDWVVAITQGSKYTHNYVLEYGIQCATQGVIVLDRIALLEPVQSRRGFLTRNHLSNLIILNPRPVFRADGNTLKASMTSAWFVFKRVGAVQGKTNIEFEVGWQRPSLKSA